jgi:cell division protein FtsL
MTVPGRRLARPGPAPPGPSPGAVPPGRRPRLTSRAAVLAVVLCAIALSLAYPVREYIAQRRQIDQLEVQQQALATRLSTLKTEQRQLNSNSYVQQQAEDKLHMCLPTVTCYVIINPQPAHSAQAASAPGSGTPWYGRLWESVRQADREPSR